MTLLAGLLLGGVVTFMLLAAIGIHLVAQAQLEAPPSYGRNAQAFGRV